MVHGRKATWKTFGRDFAIGTATMTLQEFLAAGAEQQLAKAKADSKSWAESWEALVKNTKDGWHNPDLFFDNVTSSQARAAAKKAQLEMLNLRFNLGKYPWPTYYPTLEPRILDEYEQPFDNLDPWGTE